MLRFNEKMYAAAMNGDGSTSDYTSIRDADLLGAATDLSIQANVRNLSANATLSLSVETSYDGVNWLSVFTENTAYTTGDTTKLTSVLLSGNNGGPLRRLRLWWLHTTSAYVEVWVAGRGKGRVHAPARVDASLPRVAAPILTAPPTALPLSTETPPLNVPMRRMAVPNTPPTLPMSSARVPFASSPPAAQRSIGAPGGLRPTDCTGCACSSCAGSAPGKRVPIGAYGPRPGPRDEPNRAGRRTRRAPEILDLLRYPELIRDLNPGVDPMGDPAGGGPDFGPLCELEQPPAPCDGCEEIGRTCSRFIRGYDLSGVPKYGYVCRTPGDATATALELAARCWCLQNADPLPVQRCSAYENLHARCVLHNGDFAFCGADIETILLPGGTAARCGLDRLFDPARYPRETAECRKRTGL